MSIDDPSQQMELRQQHMGREICLERGDPEKRETACDNAASKKAAQMLTKRGTASWRNGYPPTRAVITRSANEGGHYITAHPEGEKCGSRQLPHSRHLTNKTVPTRAGCVAGGQKR